MYSNLTSVQGTHGVVETSRLKATVVGHIYDVLVRDSSNKAIDVDNGVCVKVGAFTGNGLQDRYATIADDDEKVALIATPAVVKDAFTNAQAAEDNFFNIAGKLARAYEVVPEDIFGVSATMFSSGTPTVGHYVVLDGEGGYIDQSSAPSAKGFVGKVHSLAKGTFGTIVRIECVQNIDYVAPTQGGSV